MDKKISIIVPFYNTGSKYISRCIKSILEQTYKNLEIILINDGSTDTSLETVKKFKKLDNRIILINKHHTGVSNTRNIGLQHVTGDYIGFVDSDDYIDNDMFETLVHGIEKYNADISMCDLKPTKEDISTKTVPIAPFREMNREDALCELLYDHNIRNYMPVKLFKRNLFDNIKFEEGRQFEDILIAYKLFLKANKIVYTPTDMYQYFQRNNSIVHTVSSKNIYDFASAEFDRYSDILQYNINNNNNPKISLYSVYSLIFVMEKDSAWAINGNNSKAFEEIYDKYFSTLLESLKSVDKYELSSILTENEKIRLLALISGKTSFIDFIKTGKLPNSPQQTQNNYEISI